MKKLNIISIILVVIISVIPSMAIASSAFQEKHKPGINIEYKEKKETEKYDFSYSEKSKLKKVNNGNDSMENVFKIKKAGKLDEFSNVLNKKYDEKKQKYMNRQKDNFKKYGLTDKTTVLELEEKAQEYLNIYYGGIKVGSQEFKEFLKSNMRGTTGIAKKAKEDSHFGVLYTYMRTYSDNINEIYNLTLNQVCEKDFDKKFKTTYSIDVTNEYMDSNQIARSVWPPLDGNAIQNYAREYAYFNNPSYKYFSGANCTNFVSQALYNGGLYQTSYAGEENKSGFISTTTRWFHFNNNTPKGYSISTSWVRVNDLYSYLAPHYGSGSETNGSSILPALNKGFVLQGTYDMHDGDYDHSVIVTMKNGKFYYCANSNSRHDEPIQSFFSSFDEYRVIQTY